MHSVCTARIQTDPAKLGSLAGFFVWPHTERPVDGKLSMAERLVHEKPVSMTAACGLRRLGTVSHFGILKRLDVERF
jgi:hypothetical protein